MRIQFSEAIPLPPAEVYRYFETPGDWVRLYGLAGRVEKRGQGWYAVPLEHFPFPLVARVIASRHGELVRWEFGGFWRGTGEIRIKPDGEGAKVEGYEEISARWLPGISWLLEKLVMEREFRRIWALGWRRLRGGRCEPNDPRAHPEPHVG